MRVKIDNKEIYQKLIEIHTDIKMHKKLIFGSYAYTTLVLGYLIWSIITS